MMASHNALSQFSYLEGIDNKFVEMIDYFDS